MNQVMSAVRTILANHSPFPAFAIDRAWNILLANPSFEMLSTLIGADVWTSTGGDQRNLMRLFFHPQGIRLWVTNWHAIAPLLWRRAQREAEEVTLLPVLPVEITKDGVRISLFTVLATFGTAQDVTTDELRIESLFPADEATEQIFRAAGRQ